MKQKAYAKINLALDVLGTLPNGYHSVKMIMQSVTLHDTVSVKKRSDSKITLRCSNNTLPCNCNNLAYRAAEIMQKEYHIPHGFHISLKKQIPVAAGMAGGSTDAAAVIRIINLLCKLNLTTKEMCKIGSSFGADIPFCIQSKPAIAEDIGDILSPVKGLPKTAYLVFVNPKEEVSAKDIYREIDSSPIEYHVDFSKLTDALTKKNYTNAIPHMQNVMERVACKFCPHISFILNTLRKFEADHVFMTGSGATCIGLFFKKPNMRKIKKAFPNFWVTLGHPLENTAY